MHETMHEDELQVIVDLDRWLAETVMGWHLNDINWRWLDSNGESTGYTVDYTDEVWHPTSDLNQAFMCVEKMREMGWDFYLSYYWDKTCIVSFHPTDQAGFSKSMTESRNNPALAICKAIKAALSNEKEEP